MSNREHYNYRSLRIDHEPASFSLLRSYFSHKKRMTILSILILATLYLLNHLYIFRDFIYIIRPTFDKDTGQEFTELPHFYNPSLNSSQICAIHGWKERESKESSIRVIDAVIFSIELDLLELRLRELWDVVDVFIVLEANRTFSGRPKPLILQQNLNRFKWAQDKLRIETETSLGPLLNGESPFKNEHKMRDAMNQLVKKIAQTGDLIIISDVDEIPRSSTLAVFRQCTNFPSPIHLRLKTYFYSFEFFFSTNDSWRARVQLYDPELFSYSHGKMSDFILADSGWHCTFCFRYLSDFRFKMTSYSHNDRLMGRTELLTDDEIQRRICSGLDVYDMFPEVYSFKELVQKFGAIPRTTSFVDLPRGLIEHRHRFRYLLKGKCIREDYKGKFMPSR